MRRYRFLLRLILPVLLLASLSACGNSRQVDDQITIYSGRSESFISPFLAEFTKETGIKVAVRYGEASALAAQILEEGENSPADIFLSPDAGALGAVSEAGLFAKLPNSILNRVSANYRSVQSDWVGITGRVRVLGYAPDRVTKLPTTVDDLVKPEWRGRIGFAPASSYFQSFTTAMIQSRGVSETEAWLNGIKANSPKYFDKDAQIIEAIDAGEVDAGLVNHYYVWEVSEELGRAMDVKVAFFAPGDIGNLVNVSGGGILKTSAKPELGQKLLEFLLKDSIQKRFITDVHEYSLVDTSLRPEGLPALADVGAPKVDLSDLANLRRTQELLIKVGLI